MEKIKTCRICESDDLNEVLDLGDQPFANSLLINPDEPEARHPLSISYCSDCSLIQLNHTAEPSDLFSNYVWVTSTSKAARGHSEVFCREILARIDNLNDSYVLEIASNDGTFLLPFMQKGYRILGIDPAENIAEIAISNGIPTKSQFFGVKSAEEIVDEFGQAKVVVARNVLPHVANLHDLVKGLHVCLADNGLLVIEFHYAKTIYEELHYDSIYHEHLCYFTMKSMERLLNQFGLFITDLRESPISGGSLVFYVKKGINKETPNVNVYRDSENKIGVNELDSWQEFANRSYSHRERLIEILSSITGEDGPIVGYGASARSSTLLNFCGIDARFISAIADQNPLKHNLYTAGTHIPIDSPENVMKQRPDSIFILAWNFAQEIANILTERFDFTGKCIIPLPNTIRVEQVGGGK